MGKDLADAFATARAVFEEVDEALKQKLSKLMFEGPAEELTLTANAQPALMAHSIAVLRVLESDAKLDFGKHVSFVAGHSLGEYSALAAAGTFSLSDAARLLRLRGQAMQAAVPVGEGDGRIAGSGRARRRRSRRRSPQEPRGQGRGLRFRQRQRAGAGRRVGCEGRRRARAGYRQSEGAKRAVLLPVSAPFHCALMKPAADAMAEALANTKMAPPKVPLVANVTAAQVSDPETIRDLLVKQVTGRVRWRECVSYMKAQGVAQLYELGAGKVLSGLVKRIEPDVVGTALNGPADIEAFAKTL